MKKVIDFCKRWNELISIPLAILLFFLSPMLLRSVDPTAGSYDAGIFQIIIFAIICLLIFQAMVWIVLGLIWPGIRDYFEQKFIKEFKKLSAWQRLRIALFIYFSLLAVLVILSRTI